MASKLEPLTYYPQPAGDHNYTSTLHMLRPMHRDPESDPRHLQRIREHVYESPQQLGFDDPTSPPPPTPPTLHHQHHEVIKQQQQLQQQQV